MRAAEQRPFADDTLVFRVLAHLVAAGLVEREGLRLTDRGAAVLAGAEDAGVRGLGRWRRSPPVAGGLAGGTRAPKRWLRPDRGHHFPHHQLA